MEYFEQKALSTDPQLPRFWHRYVDDTFVIQKEIHKQDFLQHINCVAPDIQFTVEDNKEDGASPSCTPLLNQRLMGNCLPQCPGNLPTLISTFSGTVTITFQPSSNVIHTLSNRAQTVCSNPELLHNEKIHLRNVITQCRYPKWALDKVERRLNKPSSEASDGANNQGTTGA